MFDISVPIVVYIDGAEYKFPLGIMYSEEFGDPGYDINSYDGIVHYMCDELMQRINFWTKGIADVRNDRTTARSSRSAAGSDMFNTKHEITEQWLEWAGTDDPEEAIERMEDNGIAVFESLDECFEALHDNSDDIEDALDTIDRGWGNGVTPFPLSEYGSYREQQQLYEEWIGQHYPEDINDVW